MKKKKKNHVRTYSRTYLCRYWNVNVAYLPYRYFFDLSSSKFLRIIRIILHGCFPVYSYCIHARQNYHRSRPSLRSLGRIRFSSGFPSGTRWMDYAKKEEKRKKKEATRVRCTSRVLTRQHILSPRCSIDNRDDDGARHWALRITW